VGTRGHARNAFVTSRTSSLSRDDFSAASPYGPTAGVNPLNRNPPGCAAGSAARMDHLTSYQPRLRRSTDPPGPLRPKDRRAGGTSWAVGPNAAEGRVLADLCGIKPEMPTFSHDSAGQVRDLPADRRTLTTDGRCRSLGNRPSDLEPYSAAIRARAPTGTTEVSVLRQAAPRRPS
jgi:hypothetical protein